LNVTHRDANIFKAKALGFFLDVSLEKIILKDPMKTLHLISMICTLTFSVCLWVTETAAQQTERIYLSGKGPSDAVQWDFLCSAGRRSGQWTKIPVPSNWEQHGFGNYNYGREKFGTKVRETGTYRLGSGRKTNTCVWSSRAP
jgi:hypothetical protein